MTFHELPIGRRFLHRDSDGAGEWFYYRKTSSTTAIASTPLGQDYGEWLEFAPGEIVRPER